MRTRKKSKWVTIVVPCPNCGCGCDVKLGGDDNPTTVSSDSESEHITKRRRRERPELNPDPEPELDPQPGRSSEPDLEPEPSCRPGPEPSSDTGFESCFDSDPDPYANSDDKLDLTQTPPSTHVGGFFTKYASFNYNSSQHIMAEFYRLCASEKVNRVEARQAFRDALTLDFNEMYGMDEDDLGAWQRLCRVLVTDVPNEIEECRKIVRSRFINIVDLVDTHITEDPVLQFKSEAELSSYTRTTGKYFPNDNEHAGSLLKFLLRFIVFPIETKVGKPQEATTGK